MSSSTRCSTPAASRTTIGSRPRYRADSRIWTTPIKSTSSRCKTSESNSRGALSSWRSAAGSPPPFLTGWRATSPRAASRSAGTCRRAMRIQNSRLRLQLGLRIAVVATALATKAGAQGPRQTSQDEYTRYELLAPDTASFKIDYEVTATKTGARSFWNPIRKGSVASDEAVYDLMTGAPLKFEQVTFAQAKAHGLDDADLESDYIEVHLARPVPPDGGQARIRIVK